MCKNYLGIIGAFLLLVACNSSKKPIEMKEETNQPTRPIKDKDVAVFGGGCFWCTEAIFDEVQGVTAVTSGYAGGKTDNPTYEEVCLKDTGHAEVIKVEYDPHVISYEELLDIFWHVHDPTTLNRQGNDVGPQYRSVIYYNDEYQKKEAEESMKQSEASGLWGATPYTTSIEPMPTFYDAEQYHQEYFKNNPNQPYCSAVVSPKVQKFKEKYKDKLKSSQ